jgi:hypothetical protein
MGTIEHQGKAPSTDGTDQRPHTTPKPDKSDPGSTRAPYECAEGVGSGDALREACHWRSRGVQRDPSLLYVNLGIRIGYRGRGKGVEEMQLELPNQLETSSELGVQRSPANRGWPTERMQAIGQPYIDVQGHRFVFKLPNRAFQ